MELEKTMKATATGSVYPSRVDVWLAMVMVAAPLLAIGLGIYLIPTEGPAGWVTLFAGVIVGAVTALLAIPCHYTITEDSLIIRCGVLREKVDRKRIRSATLSSNPLSAPALSLRRVKLELDKGSRLISPVDREGFIAKLMSKEDVGR